MDLVTKRCPNCHNFIYCQKDEDTKCEMCNTAITRSTPSSTPTPAPDFPPQLYTPGSIHIEHVMPVENMGKKETTTDILQVTDPGCCGRRRLDEDGCCVTCGRDFFDPDTGAERGDGTRVPNARLSDAAPDLYDFAEKFVVWAEDMPDENYEQVEIDLIAMAKAAIAKARGQVTE